MREIHDHEIKGHPSSVQIIVVDEPGPGGACHEYALHLMAAPDSHGITSDQPTQLISFQNGPIKEVGVNGVTQEALLAVVIDRLRSFESGSFACRDNAIALKDCQSALMALQNRTRSRLQQGVEGQNIRHTEARAVEEGPSLKEQIRWLRQRILNCDDALCRTRKDVTAVPIITVEQSTMDKGEMLATMTLAHRKLEEARMWLGKTIQAMDGGTSCYDKATPATNQASTEKPSPTEKPVDAAPVQA